MTRGSATRAHAAVERKYRVRDFAALGGVTVKALLHYDRLGLLTPPRTAAGHRVYSARERERLRRILALKRVGVALASMPGLLDADPAALIAYLEEKREAIAREQARLRGTDRAIALVEESLRHASDDDRALSRLADVLDMPHEAAQMRQYFSEDVWEQAVRFYRDWPSEPWISLYRDIAAATARVSESGEAQELLRRWNLLALGLWRDLASDFRVLRKLRDGFARAWRDREQWPDTIKRRFEDYRMNDVAAFLARCSQLESSAS